jgi:hypothetical protein
MFITQDEEKTFLTCFLDIFENISSSSNIGTVRALFLGRRSGGGRVEEGRRRGGRGAEADRSEFLGRRKGSASLKI